MIDRRAVRSQQEADSNLRKLLPKFETAEQCEKRDRAIERRLNRSVSSVASVLENNLGETWKESRAYRLNFIPQAMELISSDKRQTYFVTLIPPQLRKKPGELSSFNIASAHRFVRRRLAQIGGDLIVIGSFEANPDVSLSGSVRWQGHFHIIVAGLTKKQLKKALRVHGAPRWSKPLVVSPIGSLAERLGYSTKRTVKRSIAYVGKNGRQQRNKLPLNTKEQIEFDHWLLQLPVGSRTLLMGCRLHAGKLRKA